VAGAFVEQLNDLGVELVNRLTMFGKAHVTAECRITREESNLFGGVLGAPQFLSTEHVDLDGDGCEADVRLRRRKLGLFWNKANLKNMG
jgi:hypothetical protein